MLEDEEVANQLTDIRDGAETKQLLSQKLKSKRKEAQKLNPIVHDLERHMREDEGHMREDEGRIREDEGCMREDEGRMRATKNI